MNWKTNIQVDTATKNAVINLNDWFSFTFVFKINKPFKQTERGPSSIDAGFCWGWVNFSRKAALFFLSLRRKLCVSSQYVLFPLERIWAKILSFSVLFQWEQELDAWLVNTILILKARKSIGSSLVDHPGKTMSLLFHLSFWSLQKMSVKNWLEFYLQCSEEQKMKREQWFQACSGHLNSKMLFSLHECKFQTSLSGYLIQALVRVSGRWFYL